MFIFSDWIRTIQEKENQSCEKLFSEILNTYKSYTPENSQNIKVLKDAYDFAKNIHQNQTRDSGVAYFTHPLIVASLLQYYEADAKILAAAIMHDAIEDAENVEEGMIDNEVKNIFGEEIYYLVDGVSKVSSQSKSASHKETLQKIFSHSSHDARILLIKIADRIHNISTIGSKIGEEKRQKKITETLEIFVLAAEKLQLAYFKDVLLNACSYYIFPEKFKKIEQEVIKKTVAAKKLFMKISEEIQEIHKSARIEYHSYPISNLLSRGDADTYDLKISDLFYIDIVTTSKDECYQALSWLSQKYNHKTGLLKDFIANPPENSYRALKTSMIVDNSFLVRFHILSEKMQKDNNLGVFNRIQKGENALPFFSLEEKGNTSQDFVEILQYDMLSKKKAVHNSEKGQKFIPIHSCALDAIIHFFPNKFIFLSEIFREGKKIEFYDEIFDNDILECTFSAEVQANLSWINIVQSTFGKVQLQNFLKKEEEFTKERSGKKILQQAFDVFKEGEISSVLQKFPEIFESFFVHTREELYVFIAEGIVSTKDVLLKYEEIKSRKQSFFKKIKNYCSSFFVEKIKNTMKISISSKALSYNALLHLLVCESLKNNVVIEKTAIKKKGAVNEMLVTLFSKNKENLFSLFSQLKANKKTLSLSFIPSFKFYFHLFLIGTFPFVIGFFSFLFFAFYRYDEVIVFYIFLIGIVLSNTWIYLIFSRVFTSWRNKKMRMLLLILLNTILIIFYSIYYNLGDSSQVSLFILLLFIIASAIFSLILLHRQVMTIKSNDISHPISNWEIHKKEKRKGFLLRGVSILCFGLMPVIGKYFFTEISGVFVMSLSYGFAFLMLLPWIIRHLFFLKKNNIKDGYHWTFWVVIIFDALMLLFWFLSVETISASHASLFLNFAPVLAIIISVFLFKKTASYMKNKNDFYKILLAFPLGSIGASLIIFQEKDVLSSGTYIGDIFAILMMLSDVISTIALVHYSKMKGAFSALGFVLRKIFFLGVVFVPLSFYYLWGDFPSLSYENMIGVAILSLSIFLAYWTAFESFKRIDGFVSYLFLNFSPVISILLEVVFFNFSINIYFFLGSALIIGASLWAEAVNDRCEKEFALINKRSA